MSEPMVFYRKKKGRRLINYLLKKLARKKWRAKGWTFSTRDYGDGVMGKFLKIKYHYGGGYIKYTVWDQRPDVVECTKHHLAYNVFAELVRGYDSSILIEIAG